MNMVSRATPRYPVIGYEEFMELYHSDEISLHHLRTGEGAHTSKNMAYLLALKTMQEPVTKSLVNTFIKAHGPKRGLAILNNMLGYDVEAQRIEFALSDADYIYNMISRSVNGDTEPDSFITIKGYESPKGNRYVLWEPEKFQPALDAAKAATAPIGLKRTLG